MAQKKLLFSLILICLLSTTVFGYEEFTLSEDALEFTSSVSKKVKEIALKEIRNTWIGLQMLLGMKPDFCTEDNKDLDSDTAIDFKIFVSSSMSKNLLKSYAKAANKYQGVLVLNGLPEGSWRKLAEFVNEVSEDDEWPLNMQIDNEAFNKFRVQEVPSFVLSKEEDIFSENSKVVFDKIAGSISVQRALEIFANEGELADVAAKFLERKKKCAEAF